MAKQNQARAWRVAPLTEAQARDILGWRYPRPYDFYNPPAQADPDSYVALFLRPEYAFHAVIKDGDFIGFCSFGRDGQVPGGDYTRRALDIGLGMKPCHTGQGLGYPFFEAILSFASEALAPDHYRLTVASFNARAMALYRKFGFEVCGGFVEPDSQVAYTMMMKDASVSNQFVTAQVNR